MLKKTFILLIALLLVCGCSGDSRSFRYSIDANPLCLDPQQAADYGSLLVARNIYEGLMRIDQSGQPVEGAAEGLSVSEDGLVYEFQLRSDSRWQAVSSLNKSSGQPVTAHDFVFAFVRLFDPQTKAPNAGDFFSIKNSQGVLGGGLPVESLGVSAIDDFTLRIELEYPNSHFLELLTMPAAMPCNRDFFEATKGKYGLESSAVLSNGPFYLSGWIQNSYLRLRQNGHYAHPDKPLADSVTIIIEGAQDAAERFAEERADVILHTGRNADILRTQGWSAELQNTVWGIAFNEQSLGDINIRRAFARCIDRDFFREHLPSNFVPAEGIIPPSIGIGGRNYRSTVQSNRLLLPFDPELAKSELAEIDRSGLNAVKVILPAVSDESQSPHEYVFSYISQIFQRELNIFLAVETLEESEYYKRIRERRYQIAIAPFEFNSGNPSSVLAQFTPEKNPLITKDLGLGGAIAGATRAEDTADVMGYYYSAEKEVIDQCLYLPLYYQNQYFSMGKNLSGLIIDNVNKVIDFKYAVK
ncbi:MAG: peptide ABC transporter substrate-binding protein [Oscillospiraceae bacterium]|nr:peptide ABC transporter substrate-binding protein [Oscillospiraceae bacterium]